MWLKKKVKKTSGHSGSWLTLNLSQSSALSSIETPHNLLREGPCSFSLVLESVFDWDRATNIPVKMQVGFGFLFKRKGHCDGFYKYKENATHIS